MQILRKTRKIHANAQSFRKMRKFYATTKELATKKSKTLHKVRKFYAKFTQYLRKLRKKILRSYTKILSGQPLVTHFEKTCFPI